MIEIHSEWRKKKTGEIFKVLDADEHGVSAKHYKDGQMLKEWHGSMELFLEDFEKVQGVLL